MKKQRSVKTAVLKTLATQHTSLSDMLEQVESLDREFDQEFREILDLVSKKIAKESKAKPETPVSTVQDDIDEQQEPSSAIDVSVDFAEQDEPAAHLNFNSDNQHPWLKKLFKRIAIHCHPDKLAPTEYKKSLLYMKARKALDEKSEATMISVGVEFDELPDLPLAEIKGILSKSNASINEKLNAIQSSPAWLWGMSEDKLEIKANILIQAFAQFYNMSVERNQVIPILRSYFGFNPNGSERRKVGSRPVKKLRKR